MISVETLLGYKAKYLGSFIGGKWTAAERPSGTWEAISPANVDWVLPPPSYSFDQIRWTVEAGRKAYENWSKLGLHLRVGFIKKFSDELKKRADSLARTLAFESGKTLEECKNEVLLLSNRIDVTLEHALPLIKTEIIDLGSQGHGEIHHRPKGVLVVIGPFNYPLQIPHGYIVPALVSGNVCIFKPSERAPYSAQIYLEAAEAAGFPPGVLQLLQGPAELGARLIRDLGVDGILATCSFDVGVKIQKDLAESPQRIVALEMGGKNAALIWKSTQLDQAAEALLRSAYLSAGQRCTALSRVYVERAMLPELLEKVHSAAKEIVVSHPFDVDPSPFMGPMISAFAKDRFLRYSTIAEGEGAEVIMRPKALEGVTRRNRKPLPRGHYVSPSIHLLSKWDAKSSYQTHEILGPDMFFCPVDSLEEGIAATNSTPYGLTFSMFGGSEEDFHFVADRVEAGLVYWNRPTVGAIARLPFGGWKKSGNHHPAGIYGIYSTTQVQTRVKGSA